MPTVNPRVFAFWIAVLLWLMLPPSLLLAQAQPDTPSEPAAPLDRRFTYQGGLANGNEPFTGVCDFRFILYNADAGGNQVGSTQTVNSVPVAEGVFGVTLNDGNQFGNSAFNGEQRWLEVAVRCPAGDGEFVILSPRQPLNATPNAAFALHAATATNATNATNAQSVPWSGVTGVPDAVLNPPTYTAGAGLQLNASRQFRVAFGGSGSVNTVARSDHNHLGQSWSGSIPGAGLVITNTALAGQGIVGWATNSGGANSGVVGRSDSTEGRGVVGLATATSGFTYGVYGETNSIGGSGVYGWASNGSGTNYGVQGVSGSSDGSGVFGWANADSGITTGVYGGSRSPSGRGVAGFAIATSGAAYGVYGETSSSSGGSGVYGRANTANGINYGVYGLSNSTDGVGVYGRANATSGTGTGVYGFSENATGRGVIGWAAGGPGLTYGVFGRSDSTDGKGVFGFATAATGFAEGVWGQSSSTSGRGLVGWATATSGTTYGVYGLSNSSHGIGVFGWANPATGTNFAGYFDGRLSATGAKTFRIDHPLDPANKILNHAAIESSEQLDLYSGNVILDGSGSAEVVLPAWFSALNTDFRYQLTAIGAAAPGLYIAAKIQDNRFRIGGGAPGMEVSWQITGVRHDPTALYYPLVVEEDKPEAERGTYLTPAAFGQPLERATHYQVLQMDELKRESVAQDELPRHERPAIDLPPVD